MNKAKRIILFFIILAIGSVSVIGSGGGGGGGGGNTFPAGDLYNLSDGEILSFELTGSTRNSDGSSSTIYSLSYIASRQPNTAIEGSTAKVIFVNHGQGVTSSGAAIFSTISKYLYGINSGALITVEYDNGVMCYPLSEYQPVPSEVKIGDFGDLGGLFCSDATSNATTYRNNHEEPPTAALFGWLIDLKTQF